jgi:L-lactate dehydrogenase complex protein LldE
VRTVALFVPCYVDQLRPEVGLAALDLLEGCGLDVELPREPSCCGQPFATAGEPADALRLTDRFARSFARYEAVIAPSGSCVAALRRQLAQGARAPEADTLAERVFELCEFLAAREAAGSGVPPFPPFPHRVALHASCHALRELRLGSPSETREPSRPDPARALLGRVPRVEIVPLARPDECCGFGGVFAVEEEAVSCRMAEDRLADHLAAGAEVVTSSDLSCLLHLDGVARRRGLPLRALHVAEILSGRARP